MAPFLPLAHGAVKAMSQNLPYGKIDTLQSNANGVIQPSGTSLPM
jgi:hypothetical protein